MKNEVRCFQSPNRSFICFCFVRFRFFFVRAQFPVHDFSANLPTPLRPFFFTAAGFSAASGQSARFMRNVMKTTNELTRVSTKPVKVFKRLETLDDRRDSFSDAAQVTTGRQLACCQQPPPTTVCQLVEETNCERETVVPP